MLIDQAAQSANRPAKTTGAKLHKCPGDGTLFHGSCGWWGDGGHRTLDLKESRPRLWCQPISIYLNMYIYIYILYIHIYIYHILYLYTYIYIIYLNAVRWRRLGKWNKHMGESKCLYVAMVAAGFGFSRGTWRPRRGGPRNERQSNPPAIHPQGNNFKRYQATCTLPPNWWPCCYSRS